MATRDATERTVGQRAERTGVRLTGQRFETKWAPLTTEFWAMLGVIAATLIAAAVADNFDAPRAWVIVGFVAAAYIVSRGLAKAGSAHRDAEAWRDEGSSSWGPGALRFAAAAARLGPPSHPVTRKEGQHEGCTVSKEARFQQYAHAQFRARFHWRCSFLVGSRFSGPIG